MDGLNGGIITQHTTTTRNRDQRCRSLSDLGSELQFSYHEAEKTHTLHFYRPF